MGRAVAARRNLGANLFALSALRIQKLSGLDVLLPEVEDEPNDSALAAAIQSASHIDVGAKKSTFTHRQFMDRHTAPRFAQPPKA